MLKSRSLFYVPDWHHDPVNAAAAGLWHRDTRFLDSIRLEAGAATTATVVEAGPERAVVAHGPMTVTLTLGEALVVDLDVATTPVRVWLGADFKDIFELRGWNASNRGEILRPEIEDLTIRLGYRARDGHMLTTAIRVDRPAEARPMEGGVSLVIDRPGRYRMTVEPGGVGGRARSSPTEPARIRTDDPRLNRLLDRSLADLTSLETDFPDGTMPAAGLPWYVAPFGRDVLISAWQTLHVDPGRAAAILRALAALQGRSVDPVTGEEPGKILHEARYGELARIGEIPHRPYYGSVDSTGLFLMVAAETVAWGATPGLFDELAPAIDAALTWIDGWGDVDGDGLVEYPLPDPGATPPLVARHQAWKDSTDSLHHADGSEPSGPIAPVEAQGYTYRALRTLARLAGDGPQAADLGGRADRLTRLVNDAFATGDWFAQALDGDKRPVTAIASNGAQLLFSGLVPPGASSRMATRMLQPDLWSGWGVRTLAAGEPAYDPLSYHNGSVWPHDNGIIADGCYATGNHEAGKAIFTAMIALADSSPDGSMAELYSGAAGDTPPEPAPGACLPQAWAAGTLPQILRSCLGLRPSDGALVVDPALPSFLNRVEIEGMSAFGSTGDLLVERRGSGYRVEASGFPIRT